MEHSMSSINNNGLKIIHEFEFDEQKNHFEMKYLMGLYEIIVSAHQRLIDAIKWLLLIMIVSSFLGSLLISYTMALVLLGIKEDESEEGTESWDIFLYLSYLVGSTLVLFVPCIHGAQVTSHVLRLRMLLSSHLYENKMDKKSRGVARAFLKLTEEQDLSFCLLGMLNVDVSLPLKYISLLVTYLIIFLQFDKESDPLALPFIPHGATAIDTTVSYALKNLMLYVIVLMRKR